ncbi:right-handed parallel beta-helix repeat-containing protein [Heyndrickxia sporothermodurans]|uniref:right-handed parallel beta-helix repeat-containing protein n=1 Tax=Heyndrickxia sporothermodurans TaxID=46224 RepID=UPI002E2D87D4|nr:right-handed parallel beta-helix repeat-containing protein [Heyndrickxia sporothermodurans]
MILNGDSNDNFYNYEGNSNIIIDGGIWDANGLFTPSVIGISHGKNIIIQNTLIKNVMAGHAIDCAGNKNVKIRNNKFLGYRKVKNEVYVEAIQIDALVSKKVFTGFGSIDFTITKDITIENNYFGNSYDPGMSQWGVGVGSHTAGYNIPYSKIIIKNNVFEGMTLSGIKIYNWKNVYIKNNFFTSCNHGILINTFDITYSRNEPEIPSKNDLIISNINIKENQFKNINISGILLNGKQEEYQDEIKSSNNLYINF